MMGDVNGDGRADIVGFGNSAVSVALGQSDGRFRNTRVVFPHFGFDAVWRAN